ncbi:YpjP-like protein [Amphibacillus marinus]|uniref:YpjP-like protein n=1 Tax=Amphibacillus marinus TaxID=872970 RepID=A0A1H8ME93_9BACI|nr:YpjP family protein [Amphibacillus marinus]SEO15604.1 YpjP-like protein [Amphibacillus marinus]
MKLWLKKLFVTTVAILTLGIYVPPLDVDAESTVDNKAIGSERAQSEKTTELLFNHAPVIDAQASADSLTDPVEACRLQARELTLTKLGPKILNQVDQQVIEEILPHIEYVINEIVDEPTDFQLIGQHHAGYGERIFDLYSEKDDQIVAKFHVRREKRPLDGYWFNFHYHMQDDEFEAHYPIGEVYWSKNTPPKWMS